MKLHHRIVILFFVGLFMLACVGGTVATSAPVAAPTDAAPTTVVVPTVAAPTELPPVATLAPEPTATEIQATPTPAPVGVPVRSGSYEVTVLGAVKLGRFYPGGTLLYTANPGNIIADVGVKVSNLTGSPASVKWSNVYVVEKTGEAWFPFYGSYKESGKKIDPFSLGISDKATNGDDLITFNGDIYLRLIFIVTDNDPTTFVFGFDDSPLIEITVK
jgi:hypothetical protein